MKIKSSVMKIVVPILEQYGFQLVHNAPGHYEFEDKTKLKSIYFDIGQYGTYFSVKYRVLNIGWNILFSPRNIDDKWEYQVWYNDKNEFEAGLKYFLDITIQYAIPIMNKLSQPLPLIKQEMYITLAQETSFRAMEYARKNNIPMKYSKKVLEFIENRINVIKDNEQLKTSFEKNIKEIISMGAYLGEIVLNHIPGGKWVWEMDDVEKISKYYVMYPPKITRNDFDTLMDIQAYWVHYPQFHGFSLARRYEKSIHSLHVNGD